MIRTISRKLRWLGLAMVAGASSLQIASCDITEDGVISAFADTFALAELRAELLELSPLGDFLPWWAGHHGEAME